MFALEVSFEDGVSQPEILFLRRPQGLIGSSENAHIVVDDFRALGFQLRIIRDFGRRFRCKPVSVDDSPAALPAHAFEGSYDGEASLELGPVRLHITALDFDLLLRETEPPDRAGVRVLRQACSTKAPQFPAVVVRGSPPLVVSFVPEQPIFVGRSKQCALRLDNPDISARHARLGYEAGEFWVEDLGSTNGTFVNQQQISGRVSVAPGAPIMLGRDVTLMGVASSEQLERAATTTGEGPRKAPAMDRRYPVVLSSSEVARPARLVLAPGSSITIGREPGCDMWLGAPHVSRKHCVISMAKTGAITVQDTSTNGTGTDRGVLRKGETLSVGERPQVFDFGGSVTVGVCFTEEQEQAFVASGGSMWAFTPQPDIVEQKLPPSHLEQRAERGFIRTGEPAFGSIESLRWWQQVADYYFALTPAARVLAIVVFVLLAVLSGILINLLYGVLT